MVNSQFEIRLEQSKKCYTLNFWDKEIATNLGRINRGLKRVHGLEIHYSRKLYIWKKMSQSLEK